MNLYAVVMQTGSFGSMSEWLVIGLTLACFACALILSREKADGPTSPLARIAVGLLVALVIATVASTTTYAAIYIPCTDPAGIEWYWFLIWGC